MTRTIARRLEILGAVLVLASAGWETFFERPVLDMQQDGVMFRVENKLDTLWGQVGAIRTKVDPDPRGSAFLTIPPAHEEWKMAGTREDLKRISKLAAYARALRGFLFILGSVLLIAVRRDELMGAAPLRGEDITAPGQL
jgi:hypothetical protein